MSGRAQALAAALARIALVWGVVLLVSGHLLVLASPHNRDVGVWAYAGWRLLDGDVPYRDFFDHKPPGVFALYAIGELLGGGPALVRVLDLVGALVAAWCVHRVVRRLAPSRAALADLAAGLFAMLIASPQLSRGSGQTETLTLGAIVPAYAIVASALASTSVTPRRALLAGLLAGVALLIRVSAVLDVAVLAGALALLRPRGGAAFGLGALVPGALYGAYALVTASLPQALDALWTFNAVYTEGAGPRPDPLPTGVTATLDLAPLLVGAAVAGGLGIATGVLRDRARAAWFVLAWLVAALAELAAPLRFYPHHYVYLVAPLCVAAAWLRPGMARGVVAIAVVAATGITALSSTLATAALVPVAQQRLAGTLVTPQERAARILDHDTAPSATVLVWGVEPDVLYLAKRRSATRYIYTNVVQFAGGDRRYAEILASSPDALVLAEDDANGRPLLTRRLCERFGAFTRSSDDSFGRWLVYTGRGTVRFAEDVASGRIDCVAESSLVR